MELKYKNKKTEKHILQNTPKARLDKKRESINKNMLIEGDNASILRTLAEDFNLSNKIDLVYIDPPFSTGKVFKIGSKRTSTISNSNKDIVAYRDDLKEDEYLEFIRERLIWIRKLLSEKGSIYFHIDYKIGHYIKVIMDEVFGENNFRNDITRIKCNPKNFKRKAYGNYKDLILFYTKTNNYIWNGSSVPKTEEEIKKHYSKIDDKGRRYTTTPLHAPGETENGATGKEWRGVPPPKGRHWRYPPEKLEELDKRGLIEWSKNNNPRKIIYAKDNGRKKRQDVWEFKDSQRPSYPTQKNIDLLKTIIRTSSNKNSTVLDAFCGSGTTLLASDSLNRNWIGIDKSKQAIETTKDRLESELGLLSSNYSYIKENKA